jgi:hypothetical protein
MLRGRAGVTPLAPSRDCPAPREIPSPKVKRDADEYVPGSRTALLLAAFLVRARLACSLCSSDWSITGVAMLEQDVCPGIAQMDRRYSQGRSAWPASLSSSLAGHASWNIASWLELQIGLVFGPNYRRRPPVPRKVSPPPRVPERDRVSRAVAALLVPGEARPSGPLPDQPLP